MVSQSSPVRASQCRWAPPFGVVVGYAFCGVVVGVE